MQPKSTKVDLTLVSQHASEQESRVLAHGDGKYERRDYLDKPDYDREAFKALLRHVGAILKGEQYDDETGQHHLAHVRANTGIILEYWATHTVEPGINWPHVAASPALESPPKKGVTELGLSARASQSKPERRMIAPTPDDHGEYTVHETPRPSPLASSHGISPLAAARRNLVPHSRSCE